MENERERRGTPQRGWKGNEGSSERYLRDWGINKDFEGVVERLESCWRSNGGKESYEVEDKNEEGIGVIAKRMERIKG